MNTPLQELLIYLSEFNLLKLNEINSKHLDDKVGELLKKEKFLIIDAFESGYNKQFTFGSTYYTKTFTNESK
jgi:hypothetical protein